jgi:hypothetical protein
MWAFFNGNDSVQVFYRLFIYVLPLEIHLARGESWHPINRFHPTTRSTIPPTKQSPLTLTQLNKKKT